MIATGTEGTTTELTPHLHRRGQETQRVFPAVGHANVAKLAINNECVSARKTRKISERNPT